MQNINVSERVLVTGATGYVAGWIVKRLLDAGVTVHAAVRDPQNVDKRAHLDALAASSPGAIAYFQSDLLDEGSYAEAMSGCSIVFHTASPFTVSVENAQRDLVDPALIGTRNVLNEAVRTGSVRRVVLTSSIAAICGDNADIASIPGGVLAEAQWNNTSSLTHNPYQYSKTLAEREGWRIAASQNRWDLVAVNPVIVMGPGVSPYATSESFCILRQFANGSMKLGAPHLEMGVVDVRDVADGHLAAAYRPSASGRHILCGHCTSLMEMGALLRSAFGDVYPFPRRTLPKPLVWLFGPMFSDEASRPYISCNAGWPFRANAAKSIEALGISYRPLEETLTEHFEQMLQSGRIRRR